MNNNNQQPGLLDSIKHTGNEIKGDMLINGGINAGISLLQKPSQNNNALNIKNKLGLKALNAGAHFITGAAAAPGMYAVNKAAAGIGGALSNYYSEKDKKPSLYHAGLVALPGIGAGMYSLGAIVHGVNKGKDLMQSKSLKEAGKHILDAANPVQHIRTGYSETKQALKDLLTRGTGFKAKSFGLLNLLGIAASSLPAVYSYFKLRAKKAKEDRDKKNELLGYTDDIANAVSAATAKTPNVKVAAYLPIVTPAIETVKGIERLSRIKDALRKGELVAKDLEETQKHLNKNIKRIGHDALGLGTLATAGYFYKKYKENKAKQPLRGYIYGQ